MEQGPPFAPVQRVAALGDRPPCGCIRGGLGSAYWLRKRAWRSVRGMPDPEKCQHLAADTLPKHSRLSIAAVGQSETIDYVPSVQMDLCVFCSGWLRGRLGRWPFTGDRPEADDV